MKTAVGGHSVGVDTPVSLTAEEERLPSSSDDDDDGQPAKKRKVIQEEQQDDTPEEKRDAEVDADCPAKRKAPPEESRG